MTGRTRRPCIPPLLAAAATGLLLFVSACEDTLTSDRSFLPAPETVARASASPESMKTPLDLLGADETDPLEDETTPVGGVFPGTGVFTNPVPIGQPDLAAVQDGEVTLNFVDTDIREVVKAVLGDILGLNYTLDPRVVGAVTLQTSRPLARSALLPTLEQILGLNNAALVEAGGLYQVVPVAEAARGAPVSRAEFERLRTPGYGVAVVPLEFVSATEMQSILEPFATPGALIRPSRSRNLLLIGGSRNDRANLLDLVEVFDVDWLEGMSFAIHPVQSTTADALVKDLEKVFGDSGEGPLAGLVRFVPIDRLNAILVISPRAEYLDKAEIWIDRLDVGEGVIPRIYVYYCQNTRAEQIASVLNQIFGTGEAVAAPRPELAPGLTPVEIGGLQPSAGRSSSSRGRSSATRGSVDMVRALQAQPQAPAPVPAAAQPPVAQPVPAFAGPDLAREAVVAGAEAEIRIIPDPVKNALVILATPQDYKRVHAALQKLDIQSLQVVIEATFVEVGLNDQLEFGTEWFFKTGTSQLFFPTATPSPATGFFNWFLTARGGDVQVALRALQVVTEVDLLSSPNLLVLDGEEARIQIGDEVPFQTRTSTSVEDPNAPIVSSIEYRDTGTILSVRPRVNASGLVTIELEQEVSDVAEQSGIQGNPVFTQRTIQSTIAVHDGESIVLGGQIFEDRDRSRSGVPFLSQVPVVGFLFGTQETSFTKRELLVILTPRVIRSEDEARRTTDDLIRRLHKIRPRLEEFRIRGSGGG